MEFIEALPFTRCLHAYLKDDEFKELQRALVMKPEAGDLIQGTGGFRKIRWSDSRRGKGKRGGLRIIYYYFPRDGQIWFLTIYSKEEADDLTAEQKRMLRMAIHEERRVRGMK